jgi:hypothetical protein
MNETPISSPEAFAALRAAYRQLDEKHKRAIGKWIADSKPGMFNYWMNRAHLPGGYDKRKVRGREGPYARMLDKVLLESDESDLTIDVLGSFLTSEDETFKGIVAGLQRWATPDEFERQVDDQISRYSSPFAALAGALLKCCPPNQSAEDLSARTELEALLARMEAHAVKFEEWAKSARQALRLSPDDIAKIVEAANADADRFLGLLAQHAANAGIAIEPWQTLEDLKTLIGKVSDALRTRNEIEKLSTFLKELSSTVGALQVTHRSSVERLRLSDLRDRAASETESASGQQKPAWSVKGPIFGVLWLAWAFGLRDEELEKAQTALNADGYANLAELVAHGDPIWIPKSLQSTVSVPATGSEATLLEEPQPTPIAPAVPPEREPEEAIMMSRVAPTPPTGSILTPEICKAIEPLVVAPLPESPKPTIVGQPPHPSVQPSTPNDGISKPAIAKAAPALPVLAPDSPTSTEWDESSPVVIARRALDAKDPEVRSTYLCHLAWAWLAEDETGLALHLVKTTTELDLPQAGSPPGWLLELLLLKAWITADQYAVCLRVHQLAESHADNPLPTRGTSEWQSALRLLIAAAALRPALLAPTQKVSALLSHVCDRDETPFWKAVQTFSLFAGENISASPEVIQATVSQVEWEMRAENLRSEVRHWRNIAKESKFSFAPATLVHTEWMKPGGFLQEMLEHVGSTQQTSEKALRSRLTRTDVDDEIDRAQSSVLKKRSRIDGAARKGLWRRAEEVLSFARRWLGLLDAKGSNYPSSARSHLVHLQQTVDSTTDNVLQDLGSFANAEGPEGYAIRIAANIAAREFEVIRSILGGKFWPQSGIVALHQITGRDLLRFPGWDAAAATEAPSRTRLHLLLERTSAGRLSYAEAFQEFCDHGRHDKTGVLLDVFRGIGASAEEVGRLENLRAVSIDDWRSRLLDQCGDVERRLNDAVGKGLMQATEFGNHLNTVQRHREVLNRPGICDRD